MKPIRPLPGSLANPRGRGEPLVRLLAAAVLAAATITSLGCSVRSLAINALADSLAASGDVFASDADPELVGAAVPFALKTTESLLAERPRHQELLLTACRGFAQYAYAFVETNAERLEEEDFDQAEHEFERALALYLRGRDYCLRSLELAHPGMTERLRLSPHAALEELREPRVELLFWTGAAWGGAIGIGQDRAELVADVPAVKALMERALVLDESYDHGAIHGVLIALEALPEAMGGSAERARHHFERAVALSRGLSASPYVTLAETVAVAEQDWREFERLLHAALAIDPDVEPSLRLANVLAQRKARWLLDRIEHYFLDYQAEPE